MLIKYCDHCHKRLNVGETCCCTLKQKNKEYFSDDFYRSAIWNKAREICIEQCCGLDLYSLYINHSIEYGFTVHHIIPLDDEPKLKLAQSNLIYLTESDHRLIHSMYDNGKYDETVSLLRRIKKDFITGGM